MPETPSSEPVEEQYPTVTYRKYRIKRFRRHIGDRWFWVAEIWKPDGKAAHMSVMKSCEKYELKDANDEADRFVGIMILNNGKVPASEITPDIVFKTTDDGLSVLNPQSKSGKPQWCPEHWAAVERGMVAGTHNGIVAGLLLASLTIQKLHAVGIVRGDPANPYVMEMIRDSYSPFCCYLGQETVNLIMLQSHVEQLKTSGLLQEIDSQLKNRK